MRETFFNRKYPIFSSPRLGDKQACLVNSVCDIVYKCSQVIDELIRIGLLLQFKQGDLNKQNASLLLASGPQTDAIWIWRSLTQKRLQLV